MQRQGYLTIRGRLPSLIALIALVLLAAMGWLGWRMLAQNLVIEKQRRQEGMESAASILCRELDRTLTAWEAALSKSSPEAYSGLPPGASVYWQDLKGLVHRLGVPLPFYPVAAKAGEPAPGLFAKAEEWEFQGVDPQRAAAEYRKLARSSDIGMRGAALMRLARCLRKQGRIEDAISIYAELATLGGTDVAGTPAEILARSERVRLFQATGDEESRRREAALLADILDSGRYAIDRSTLDFYRQFLLSEPTGTSPSFARAEALQGAWADVEQTPRPATSRRAWTGRDSSLITLAHKGPERTIVMVAGMDVLVSEISQTIGFLRIRFRLESADGQPIWGGEEPLVGIQAARSARETGLPFAVVVAGSDPAGEQALLNGRRTLAIAGFTILLLMIAAAMYFIYRAISRELNVARLQSEFVSAVSHEFRTPLTALCHISELLEEGKVDAGQGMPYFSALARESRRLRGMVESLLDFARMDSGRQVYHPEVLETASVVRDIVEEFREHAFDGGGRVELDGLAESKWIRVDREAIARAIWNLIDNAIKYSPANTAVRVSVQALDGQVAISVRDEGAGIPRHEQREILRKFVRGSAAQAMDVKGTGIGLAMVNHIVKAHGGRLQVESEPGRGSCFTILLPVEKAPP
jgi:signal transduction histidine kinase